MPAQRGFTLLEVVIALGILAVSLGVLLETQVSSLNNASRARHLTIASLLARSKMIDIEQKLFDEGFTAGEVEESGDFADEGHPEIKWSYTISEVELDLSSLSSLCGEEEDDVLGSCSSILGGVAGPLEGVATQVASSVRAVDLEVRWPDGKYTEAMKVRALFTREDVSAPASPAAPGSPSSPPTPGSPGQLLQSPLGNPIRGVR